MFTEQPAKRLEALVAHLDSGKLGHAKFNFALWHTSFDSASENGYGFDRRKRQFRNKCGFSGCAAGELPVCFPKQWKFYRDRVHLRGKEGLGVDCNDVVGDMAIFFGLERQEVRHCFVPNRQLPGYGGCGHSLSREASLPEVVYHLRQFILWKRTEAGLVTPLVRLQPTPAH